VIRVEAGRVLKRLICDLSLLVDTGVLHASHNVHYDEIDHTVIVDARSLSSRLCMSLLVRLSVITIKLLNASLNIHDLGVYVG